jgi:hypothetical protein
VIRAFELDVRDGGAFQRAEQDSPQAVANGGSKAALKRLGGEFCICVGRYMLVARDARG